METGNEHFANQGSSVPRFVTESSLMEERSVKVENSHFRLLSAAQKDHMLKLPISYHRNITLMF